MNANTMVKAGVAVILITAGTVLGNKAIKQAGKEMIRMVA